MRMVIPIRGKLRPIQNPWVSEDDVEWVGFVGRSRKAYIKGLAAAGKEHVWKELLAVVVFESLEPDEWHSPAPDWFAGCDEAIPKMPSTYKLQ